MITDEDHANGSLLDSCVELLNVAITALNTDNYIAASVREDVASCAGRVYFRKLVAGETKGANTIDCEPPDNVMGVSRQVGIRWMQLVSATPEDLNTAASRSLPQLYSYHTETETDPNGGTRLVGIIDTNGTAPVQVKVFAARKLPKYAAGDTIYLSPLYKNLILYALEQRMVMRYKLGAYKDFVEQSLLEAKDSIDKNAAVNRPMTNIGNMSGSYLDDYYNGLAGLGW